MAELAYAGGELALFAEAKNWKRYFGRTLEPHLRGHVLEVGAGLGGTTRVLAQGAFVTAFTALEPDADLLAALETTVAELRRERGIPMRALGGTLRDVPAQERFDTIVYIDVLEHIEDDQAELAYAASRLTQGGRLVVLSPAHAALFSEFDRQVGHYRRYDKRSLARVAPPGLTLRALRYLDSVGMLASFANRALLKASLPTKGQIRLWDGLMIPASRVLDVLTAGRLGKTVIGVWER